MEANRKRKLTQWPGYNSDVPETGEGIRVLRMGTRLALTFVLLLSATAFAQQSSPAEVTVYRPQGEPDLSVSADILSQEYCRLTPEDHEVHFSVRLTFTNVSNHRVILQREVEPPSYVHVARNVSDGQKRKFEYVFNLGFPTGLSTAPEFGDRPDETYFITLLPGQSYEATVTTEIMVAEKSAQTGRGPGGDHVLQVALNTLPYQSGIYTNPVNAKQLSPRWSKYGHLATGWIYSDFAPFSLPEVFDDAVCEFS